MRKIEEQMVRAVYAVRNWRSDNTEVKIRDGFAYVYLHNNHIATVDQHGGVKVNKATLRDWPTTTTKSRLQALGVNVYTEDRVTYLNGEPV